MNTDRPLERSLLNRECHLLCRNSQLLLGVPGWAGSLGSAPAWGQEQETLPACFDSELLWACPGALLGSSLDPLGPTQDLPLQGLDPTLGGELTSVASGCPKACSQGRAKPRAPRVSHRGGSGENGAALGWHQAAQLSSPPLDSSKGLPQIHSSVPMGSACSSGPCTAQSCPVSEVGLWTSTMTALTIPSQEHLYTLRDVLELGCHFETPSKAL